MEEYIQTPEIQEIDPKRVELQEKSIEVLKEMKILSETEDGDLAVDIDSLRNFSTRKFKETFPSESEGGMSAPYVRENAGSTQMLFTEVLSGLEVYKKGQEDLGKKKLVFSPETADDLSNVEKMENSWVSLGDIGITTSWEDKYPTDNPDLNLSKLEVHIPYMIYKEGHGQRDESGTLWVDKQIGNPEAGRQKISAGWFKKNGFQGPKNLRIDQNPMQLLEEHGAEWMHQNLLKPEDFPKSNSKRTEWNVQESGRLEIKGIAYWVGSEYSDGKVEIVSPNEYLVYDKDGNPKAILNSNVSSDKLSETTVVSKENGRKVLLVNKPAVNITPIENLGTFSNLGLGGNKKIRETITYKREFDNFLNFRESLPAEKQEDLKSFNLKDQINISRSIRNIGEYGDENAGLRARDFLDKTGKVGMQILAETEARGGLDQRLLDIKDLEESEREKLLQDYTSFRESITKWGDVLMKMADDSKLDLHSKALISRNTEALLSRSTDYLLVDMNNPQEVSEMKKLAQGLACLSSILSGEADYNFRQGEDKQSGAKLGRYEMKDGGELNVAIRPEANENGQARLSFVYRSPEGQKADLRLDHDNFGLSLDIARRGTAFHENLTDLGKSHHTQAIFEKGLSMDNSEFKKIQNQVINTLGWS